jgi:hypothetical protein
MILIITCNSNISKPFWRSFQWHSILSNLDTIFIFKLGSIKNLKIKIKKCVNGSLRNPIHWFTHSTHLCKWLSLSSTFATSQIWDHIRLLNTIINSQHDNWVIGMWTTFHKRWNAPRTTFAEFWNTLAGSTQIILWVEMLKFSKDIFFKEQNFVKENRESLGTFKFSTWNLQN